VGGNYWFEMHEGGTLNQAKRLVSQGNARTKDKQIARPSWYEPHPSK
jgi:ribosomal protein S4